MGLAPALGGACLVGRVEHADVGTGAKGGADGHGTGSLFAWVFYAFVVWAVVLLVIGVRTVHGWSWSRSLAGVGFATAIAAGLAVAVSVLYAL